MGRSGKVIKTCTHATDELLWHPKKIRIQKRRYHCLAMSAWCTDPFMRRFVPLPKDGRLIGTIECRGLRLFDGSTVAASASSLS